MGRDGAELDVGSLTGHAGDHAVLAGRRVLVVGASSGIGRALVLAAARAGAAVVAVARRTDLLDSLVVEAEAETETETEAEATGVPLVGAGTEIGSSVGGSAVVALTCDVRDPVAVDAMVIRAAEALGGLDSVVYASGVNHLALLADTDADTWRRLFETNVVGASLVTRAACPVLRRGHPDRVGRVAFLSSHSVPDPWPALGAYAATKAALDSVVTSWRIEERDLAFTRVVVGPTLTDMAGRWDPEVANEMFSWWAEDGRLGQHEPVPAEVVADRLVAWLADPDPPADLLLV